MKIRLTTVYVDDQDKALRFYSDVLGFTKKTEFPVGVDRWLTVTSPEEPDEPELALVPDGHPAVRPFKAALAADGIPVASFAVQDVHREGARLRGLGVHFTQEPLQMGQASQRSWMPPAATSSKSPPRCPRQANHAIKTWRGFGRRSELNNPDPRGGLHT